MVNIHVHFVDLRSLLLLIFTRPQSKVQSPGGSDLWIGKPSSASEIDLIKVDHKIMAVVAH